MAIQFPDVVDTYFSSEIQLGSILSQFSNPQLAGLHCSPLMTSPKDGTKCHIIEELSFLSPQQHSVNLSVSKNTYVGTMLILKLPTVDTICQALNLVCKKILKFSK
jgi:hypothetical protein